MQLHDLGEIREPREYPAVSILAPLQRHRPGNPEDPIRIRNLTDRARERLRDELGARASEPIVRGIEEAVASIDLRNPPEGVAIFVAPGESRVLTLPFSVPERVEIDDTFVTRDLVRGILCSPRYRVLALGDKPTRLFAGVGTVLDECRTGGFPIVVEGAHGEPLASGGYSVHTSRSEEQHRNFFRQVDRAFGTVTADDPLPLVLAGAERDLAYFDEVTSHGRAIIGRLHGNHEATQADELARLVGPLVDAYSASLRAAAIADLNEAIGPGRGVVGVKAVGDAALAGRARILLVEEDFVDEVIEQVLDLSGEVVIVGPGELGEHGPIAALLRY